MNWTFHDTVDVSVVLTIAAGVLALLGRDGPDLCGSWIPVSVEEDEAAVLVDAYCWLHVLPL